MVINFQDLEQSLTVAIGRLLDIEDATKGDKVCVQLSFRKILELYESLLPDYLDSAGIDSEWMDVIRETNEQG